MAERKHDYVRECLTCGEEFDWRDLGERQWSARTCSDECRKARHRHNVKAAYSRPANYARIKVRKNELRAENVEKFRAIASVRREAKRERVRAYDREYHRDRRAKLRAAQDD